MKYRLIALDLDGTLLGPDQEVSQENRRILREVQAKGIHVVLVTGRSFAAARPFATELELGDVPLVSHNGALVKLAASCALLECKPLSPLLAMNAVKLSRAHEVIVSLSDEPEGLGRIVLEQEPTGKLLQYLKKSGAPYHVVDCICEHLVEISARGGNPIHITFSGSCESVDKIDGLFAECISSGYRFVKTAYRKRGFSIGDLLSEEASKSGGLDMVVRHLSLEARDVLAMGDNENDLDMLRYAGKAVLMGNAEPHLLEPGFSLTGSNTEDGVAEALKRWVIQDSAGTRTFTQSVS